MKNIEEASERYEKMKDKEYLSVSETAFLLSVGRTTIYRYLHSGTLKAFQTDGKTFIRKADIDMMFNESEQYRTHSRKEKKLITEFYTLSEIKNKYKIKDSWIYKIVKENSIPKTLVRGKCYFSKKHIDRYFEKRGFGSMQHIEEWYSVKDIKDKHGLSIQAIYSFACFLCYHCCCDSCFLVYPIDVKKFAVTLHRRMDIQNAILPKANREKAKFLRLQKKRFPMNRCSYL